MIKIFDKDEKQRRFFFHNWVYLIFLAFCMKKRKKGLTKTFIFFQTEVNYENVKELPYFDMVFDEVCRLYPTASL